MSLAFMSQAARATDTGVQLSLRSCFGPFSGPWSCDPWQRTRARHRLCGVEVGGVSTETGESSPGVGNGQMRGWEHSWGGCGQLHTLPQPLCCS